MKKNVAVALRKTAIQTTPAGTAIAAVIHRLARRYAALIWAVTGVRLTSRSAVISTIGITALGLAVCSAGCLPVSLPLFLVFTLTVPVLWK